jgi:formylglycine-generating enzyme required for sulfatase activity
VNTPVDAAQAGAALEVFRRYCGDAESAGEQIREISIELVRSARPSMSLEVQSFVWRVALLTGQDDPELRELCARFLETHRELAWRWVSSTEPADDAQTRVFASALRAEDVPKLIALLDRGSTPHAAALARSVADEAVFSQLRDRAAAEFLLVPCGWFTQGGGPKADQLPATRRWLPSFYAARFPVTAGQWNDRADSAGGGAAAADAELPATGVDWHQAVAFADGLGRRLLTEGEWEKAARGPAGTVYPWGEEFLPGRANTAESGLARLTPVDAFAGPGDSGYGISDMVGNAWEWTSSRYAGYGSQIRGADSRRLDDTADRVLRGGAFDFDATWCNALNRYRCSPHRGWDTHGLRLAY